MLESFVSWLPRARLLTLQGSRSSCGEHDGRDGCCCAAGDADDGVAAAGDGGFRRHCCCTGVTSEDVPWPAADVSAPYHCRNDVKDASGSHRAAAGACVALTDGGPHRQPSVPVDDDGSGCSSLVRDDHAAEEEVPVVEHSAVEHWSGVVNVVVAEVLGAFEGVAAVEDEPCVAAEEDVRASSYSGGKNVKGNSQ